MATIRVETFLPPIVEIGDERKVPPQENVLPRTIPVESLPSGTEEATDITPFYWKNRNHKKVNVTGRRKVKLYKDAESGCVIVMEKHRFNLRIFGLLNTLIDRYPI